MVEFSAGDRHFPSGGTSVEGCPQDGLVRPAEWCFWRAADQTRAGCVVETRAKELLSETTFSMLHILLLRQDTSCLQNPVWFSFFGIKGSFLYNLTREVCDERIKDGIINDIGGSLSSGNQKKIAKSFTVSFLSSTLNMRGWSVSLRIIAQEGFLSWIKVSPPQKYCPCLALVYTPAAGKQA